MKKDIIKQLKSLVVQFQEETKSTNVLEFATWFDCKRNYIEIQEEQLRQMVKK